MDLFKLFEKFADCETVRTDENEKEYSEKAMTDAMFVTVTSKIIKEVGEGKTFTTRNGEALNLDIVMPHLITRLFTITEPDEEGDFKLEHDANRDKGDISWITNREAKILVNFLNAHLNGA